MREVGRGSGVGHNMFKVLQMLQKIVVNEDHNDELICGCPHTTVKQWLFIVVEYVITLVVLLGATVGIAFLVSKVFT